MTVLASQPSVSIETLTTHLTCSPSLPGLPTVFMTSRSRSSSVRLSASRPGKRARYSALNSSISRAAIFLKSALIAFARFELLAVDQDRVGPRAPAAVLLVVEERQSARARRSVCRRRSAFSQPEM